MATSTIFLSSVLMVLMKLQAIQLVYVASSLHIPLAHTQGKALSRINGNRKQIHALDVNRRCGRIERLYNSHIINTAYYRISTRRFVDENNNIDNFQHHNEAAADEDFEYGKFEVDDDDIGPSSSPNPSTEKKDETRAQMEQQQKQIDLLMKMMKNQQQQLHQNQQQTNQSTKSTSKKGTNLNNNKVTPTLPPPLPGMFDEYTSEDELLDYNTESTNDLNPSSSQQHTPSSSTVSSGTNTNNLTGNVVPLAPLKVMLFIDGTWLYYSLHRRSEDRDPIVKKFGRGWQYRYRFDWNALPRIVCEELVGQQMNLGWTATGSAEQIANNAHANNINLLAQRPMEIVRASVFTSYKKTTDPNSFRVKMYNEMADANYDLHMLESVGNGPEKCVDISLAVEMLHYATVPNAYDVAILLSGDKDFIPALVRTRQKGRKVGIVSMKTGCNRALYESPHIKDFNVVWIDDFLDQLLVPLPPDQVDSVVESVHDRGLLSAFTITKVVYDFIANSPFDKVSSRDIGRYLKGLEIKDGTTLLDDVKLGQGGLRRFLQDRMPSVFEITDRTPSEKMLHHDINDKSYWIAVKTHARDVMLMEAKNSSFTDEEKQFLKDYQTKLADGDDLKEEAYFYTIESTSESFEFQSTSTQKDTSFNTSSDVREEERIANKQDELSKLTVPALKDLCRKRSLHVSGTKATLIERIINDFKTKDSQTITTVDSDEDQDQVDMRKDPISKYLEDLVKYYITESGGMVTSRDLGRFLATNKAYQSNSISALQELKENYGGVASFLNQRTKLFVIVRDHNQHPGDSSDNYNFGIRLQGTRINNIRQGHSQKSAKQKQSFSSLHLRSQSHQADNSLSDYIEALIKEYLKARGGLASSRDIGRYLAANAAMGTSNNIQSNHGRRQTALQQLKDNYGSLASYLSSKADIFTTVSGRLVETSIDGPPSQHTFGVQLR